MSLSLSIKLDGVLRQEERIETHTPVTVQTLSDILTHSKAVLHRPSASITTAQVLKTVMIFHSGRCMALIIAYGRLLKGIS